VIFLVVYYTKQKQVEVADLGENGMVKTYREDGSIYTEANYINGSLDGICKTYHPNGKVFRVENYSNNILQGRVLQYYQSGILYSETNYDSGKTEGVVKRYHKDGKLKAEAPFKNGCECLGLKEYVLNGDPRPHYPEIVIETDDKVVESGAYYIRLSLTERVKKAEFYYGELKEGCLHDGLIPIRPTGKDTGEIGYKLVKGQTLTEQINIVAKIETIAGNILVKQELLKVSINHHLF
jgi:antitoxin component YwqK of YwqJK toxin-antitoxin module